MILILLIYKYFFHYYSPKLAIGATKKKKKFVRCKNGHEKNETYTFPNEWFATIAFCNTKIVI